MATVAALLLCLAGAAAAQGWGIRYAQGPDPAVAAWPSWPHPTACDGVSFDPVSVFSGPTEAELGSGGAELALRRYLDEGLYPHVPTRFWRPVSVTETSAHFASGRLQQGLFWLDFELVDGSWRVAGDLEECRPRTVRKGILAARWAPVDGQVLTPATRRIRVDLASPYRECNGGRDDSRAAEAPSFVSRGKRLVLSIWVPPAPELPPGFAYNCKGRKRTPLSVRLPGRLGSRSLWDGGVYPPVLEVPSRSSRLRQ
jgi:hypothetical protein